MSCNGCRVLRKGCSDNCMLRQSLQWIDSPQAQAHATVFVAKFFGRAGLMSFISSVPENQRSSLFQSLLFEAVGRTINPVGGAVGLLWTRNWHLCQAAVETVLRGGTLQELPQFDDGSEFGVDWFRTRDSRSKVMMKRNGFDDDDDDVAKCGASDVDLGLMYGGGKQREATPSEESETMMLGSGLGECSAVGGQRKLLRLFT